MTTRRFEFHRPNRWLTGYAVVFMLLLYVPVLFIPLFSFNAGIHARFPIENFTFDWYRQMVQRATMMQALYNSLKVAAVVSVVSTVMAVFAAKAIVRYRIPGKRSIVSMIMLPLVVPGIIFGVALLMLLSSMQVPLSLITIGAGHMVICLPFSIATLLPRFEGYDASFDEAAADLGESPWFVFWRVTVPIILPGIVASLLMSFTISFDEFIIAFFLAGNEPTLPIYIWNQLRFPQNFPTILAMGSLILFFSFVLVFLGLWIGRMGTIKLVDKETIA
ncbi:MAG: ABC transporter permease [Rubellimicrobium sp.]|nr:ABC transporter permease [Rubellimicrobium sp.]